MEQLASLEAIDKALEKEPVGRMDYDHQGPEIAPRAPLWSRAVAAIGTALVISGLLAVLSNFVNVRPKEESPEAALDRLLEARVATFVVKSRGAIEKKALVAKRGGRSQRAVAGTYAANEDSF